MWLPMRLRLRRLPMRLRLRRLPMRLRLRRLPMRLRLRLLLILMRLHAARRALAGHRHERVPLTVLYDGRRIV